MKGSSDLLAELDASDQRGPIEQINSWRNATMHGSDFWAKRVPLLMNMICFLIFDSIGESVYDKNRAKVAMDARGFAETGRAEEATRLNVFPPDLQVVDL
jgi:hypothetical protein